MEIQPGSSNFVVYTRVSPSLITPSSHFYYNGFWWSGSQFQLFPNYLSPSPAHMQLTPTVISSLSLPPLEQPLWPPASAETSLENRASPSLAEPPRLEDERLRPAQEDDFPRLFPPKLLDQNLHLASSMVPQELQSSRFPCLLCGMVFTSNDSLLHHNKSHMPPFGHLEGQYKVVDTAPQVSCDTCGKSYATKKTLRAHHRRLHLGTYGCSFCEKVFPSMKRLTTHLKKH